MCTNTCTAISAKQEAPDGSECSRRPRCGSELLVEWPSPSTDQDQRGNDPKGNSASERNGCSNSTSSCDNGASSSKGYTTSTNRSRTSSNQQKPTVNFSETVQIQIIPSFGDYSLERIGKIYYTKADLADQRAEYVATAKAMHRRHRRGEDPLQVHEVKLKTIRQEHDHQPSIIVSTTTRGLEHMASPRTIDLHRQEQIDIINVVLLAQENDFTPEEIAIIYSHRARSAKRRARSFGLADAELAEL